MRAPSLSLGLPARLPSGAQTTAPATAAGPLCPLWRRHKGRPEGSLCITVLSLLPVCFPEATAAPTSAARLPTPAPVTAQPWSPGQAFPARTWSSCSSTPQVGRDHLSAASLSTPPPRLLLLLCTSLRGQVPRAQLVLCSRRFFPASPKAVEGTSLIGSASCLMEPAPVLQP